LAYSRPVRVEWDEEKDRANRRKHGISFEEASGLFRGEADYLEIFDDAHSDLEDRFLAIGPIQRGLVIISWTEREEETIRIISARWVSRRERFLYEAYLERP
jgi:uncharacterized protein